LQVADYGSGSVHSSMIGHDTPVPSTCCIYANTLGLITVITVLMPTLIIVIIMCTEGVRLQFCVKLAMRLHDLQVHAITCTDVRRKATIVRQACQATARLMHKYHRSNLTCKWSRLYCTTSQSNVDMETNTNYYGRNAAASSVL